MNENLTKLESLIDPEVMAPMISGKLEKAITVKAHKFSKSAVAAIEAAGGKTEVI